MKEKQILLKTFILSKKRIVVLKIRAIFKINFDQLNQLFCRFGSDKESAWRKVRIAQKRSFKKSLHMFKSFPLTFFFFVVNISVHNSP